MGLKSKPGSYGHTFETSHRFRPKSTFDLDLADSQKRTPMRIGVFVRRLRDDDQYGRHHYEDQSLHFDLNSNYERPNDPRTYTSICLRNNLSSYDPTPMIYGYKQAGALPGGNDELDLAPKTDRRLQKVGTDRIATIGQGECGTALIAEFPPGHECIWAIFGFDFDFDPVCILHAAPCVHQGERLAACKAPKFDPIREDICMIFQQWRCLPDGNACTLGRASSQEGTWYLKGSRIHGLSVDLDLSPHPFKLRVRIWQSKHEKQPVWYCCVRRPEKSTASPLPVIQTSTADMLAATRVAELVRLGLF